MCVSPEHQGEMGEGTGWVRGGGARRDSGNRQQQQQWKTSGLCLSKINVFFPTMQHDSVKVESNCIEGYDTMLEKKITDCNIVLRTRLTPLGYIFKGTVHPKIHNFASDLWCY